MSISSRCLARVIRARASTTTRSSSTNVESEVSGGKGSPFSAYMKALPSGGSTQLSSAPFSAYMKAFPVQSKPAQAKVAPLPPMVDMEPLPSDTDRNQIDVMTQEDMDSLVSLETTTTTETTPAHAFPDIVRGTRFRKSCYFDATVESGVQKFVTYNHMLLPSFYSKQEYESLRNDVCLWDVAAQRQVELVGPDAYKLAELITPRKLSNMKFGDCLYAITTDTEGIVTNDPIVLKVAEDRYWFSVADSDLVLWTKAIAWALGLNVRVHEAEVSPCALQGPKSVPLLQDLFGDWVADLKYYKFRETHLDGIPLLLARSGWSPERGYELYLTDESRGNELWNRLMEAGQKYGIKPGCPNQARRIEGGMLSYGADIKQHTALELGLPLKMVMKDEEFIGKKALQQQLDAGGPQRLIMGVKLTCPEPLQHDFFQPWKITDGDGVDIGTVTSFSYAPTLAANLGIVTVQRDFAVPGTQVRVSTPDGDQAATIEKLPFMKRM